MVTQQDNHNQALLLINKLLGPNAAASAPPQAHPQAHPSQPLPLPPPIPPSGNFLQFNAPAAHLPPFTPYFPPSQPLSNQPTALISHPAAAKTATPEKNNSFSGEHERRSSKSSKYNDPMYKKSSRKRRYEDGTHGHRSSKASSFDDLIASHGTSSANRKSRDSVNTASQKVMGKQIRAILQQPETEKSKAKTRSADISEKREKLKKSKHKKSRGEKSYTDLAELLPDESVARKRRKIQDKVRSKRDSANETPSKSESVYDYMHYDPDTEALKKKRERILSALHKEEPDPKMDDIDAALKEIEKETQDEDKAEEPKDDQMDLQEIQKGPEPNHSKESTTAEDREVEDVFEAPTTPKTVVISNSVGAEKRVGIRGSLSHPPSPKPSEMEIKQVLEDMEEGELSEDEEEYNKLISDVEKAEKMETTPSTANITVADISPAKAPPAKAPPATPEKTAPAQSSAGAAKKVESSSESILSKINLNTGVQDNSAKSLKSIPFLATTQVKKKDASILDDLAFLNSIKTKYNQVTPAPTKHMESVESKSKELIEQLLRQDKLNRDKEKHRRNKEKQREKDKREREKAREEKRREKLRELEQLDLLKSKSYSPSKDYAKSKTKSRELKELNKLASNASRKLKFEFKNNFIKAAISFEGTLTKSTIDNTILSEEKIHTVENFVETKEHRFDNGLVIQTSVKRVEEQELCKSLKPVRYDYSKVNEEYPEYAVAGAIAYRLKEQKQRLIHRIVETIGKAKSLELLFETEAIEKNGGEMTSKGDRRKQPGGVFLGLLKKHLPEDDVKYIFSFEDEIESTSYAARKRVQRQEKKKRYTKNRRENNLVKALDNALNFNTKEEEDISDSIISHIPAPALTPQLPLIMPKPKKFQSSFVKPVVNKEFVTVGVTKSEPAKEKHTATKIEAMKKGYSAFVKKGAAEKAAVFKPSEISRMSEESSLFDDLMKLTKTTVDKQKENGDVLPTDSESGADFNMLSANQSTVSRSRDFNMPLVQQFVAPLVQPPPPPYLPMDEVESESETRISESESKPAIAGKTAVQMSGLQTLKAISVDRAAAILDQDSAEISEEGECSASDDEHMES